VDGGVQMGNGSVRRQVFAMLGLMVWPLGSLMHAIYEAILKRQTKYERERRELGLNVLRRLGVCAGVLSWGSAIRRPSLSAIGICQPWSC
jgi:hypothetical protein